MSDNIKPLWHLHSCLSSNLLWWRIYYNIYMVYSNIRKPSQYTDFELGMEYIKFWYVGYFPWNLNGLSTSNKTLFNGLAFRYVITYSGLKGWSVVKKRTSFYILNEGLVFNILLFLLQEAEHFENGTHLWISTFSSKVSMMQAHETELNFYCSRGSGK